MIHCKKCGVIPEKKENLPIALPEDVEITGKENPLNHHPNWKYCKCPKYGDDAIRETDIMDTFMQSSWYFLRYTILPNVTFDNYEKSFLKDIKNLTDKKFNWTVNINGNSKT